MRDEDEIRITFRMSRTLRDCISEIAHKNGRSMNAEIAFRLGLVESEYNLSKMLKASGVTTEEHLETRKLVEKTFPSRSGVDGNEQQISHCEVDGDFYALSNEKRELVNQLIRAIKK